MPCVRAALAATAPELVTFVTVSAVLSAPPYTGVVAWPGAWSQSTTRMPAPSATVPVTVTAPLFATVMLPEPRASITMPNRSDLIVAAFVISAGVAPTMSETTRMPRASAPVPPVIVPPVVTTLMLALLG